MSTVIEVMRWYVVAATVVVAVVGSFQWRRWLSYLPENRQAWLALVLLNLSAFVGTLVSLHRHTAGGVQTYVLLVAVTFEVWAVCYPVGHRLQQRRDARRFIQHSTRKE